MKQCPMCKRGYGDEISYCLHDGTYLSPWRDPEETIPISAQFIPTKSAPAPTPAQRPKESWLASLAIIGGFLIVAILIIGIPVWDRALRKFAYTSQNSFSTNKEGAAPTPTVNPTLTPKASVPHTTSTPTPEPTATPPKPRIVVDKRGLISAGIEEVLFQGHAGEVIRVSLTSTNGDPSYSITHIGTGNAITPLGDMRGPWTGTLTFDGTYKILLCCGNQEQPTNYSLKVALKKEQE